MNGDDVFIANARSEMEKELKALLEKKKGVSGQATRHAKAQEVLAANKPRFNSNDLKTLISWKIGKPCPSSCSSSGDRQRKWEEVKDLEAPPHEWSEADESLIVDLQKKVDDLPIDNTVLARNKERMHDQAMASLHTLSKEDRKRALKTLQALERDDADLSSQ